MQPTPRPTSLFLFMIVAAIAAFAFSSCKFGGTVGMPIYGAVELVNEQNAPVAFIRSDGDTTIARSAMRGQAFVGDKATGITVLGPLTLEARDQVILISRKRNFRGTFAPGQALPAWVMETGLLRPGDVERFGLVIAAADDPQPGNPTP